ncbi:MAG TPA: hypothetical protein VFG58_02340 [Solirubrobacterales bacterium]|nr:hypothetical protein [Solirubrobacterales bacterium]
MPHQIANSVRREDGTASVELIGVVPFLLLAILVAAQIGIAGYAMWSAGIAARAGARAGLVGGDAARAARKALPSGLRDGAKVSDDGSVSVRVAIPRIVPAMPVLLVGASAALEPGGG